MNSTFCPACLGSHSVTFVTTPCDREYYVSRKAAAEVRQCSGCKCLYQAPFPSSTETSLFYTSDYQNYSKSKAPFISQLFQWATQRSAFSFLKRFGRDASVLDYGSNQGAFLETLYRAGMRDLTGFDVVPLEHPNGHFRFFNSLQALKETGKRFDVIRMNHVVEHLSNLDQTMLDLQCLLKPGGKLIGQTPNASHYTARLFRGFWGPLHFPYHTVLFTDAGLKAASSRWNLLLESCSPTLQPTGWAMSFENLLKPVLFSRTRGRSPIYIAFLLLSGPVVILDYLLNGKTSGTAIMNFELRQP